LDTAQLDTAQLYTVQLDTAQLDTVQLDTVQLDTAQLDTAQLDTVQLDTAQLDTVQLDTAQLDTLQLDTALRCKITSSARFILYVWFNSCSRRRQLRSSIELKIWSFKIEAQFLCCSVEAEFLRICQIIALKVVKYLCI
jgi:autotransporter translocation and assembly factor TamB